MTLSWWPHLSEPILSLKWSKDGQMTRAVWRVSPLASSTCPPVAPTPGAHPSLALLVIPGLALLPLGAAALSSSCWFSSGRESSASGSFPCLCSGDVGRGPVYNVPKTVRGGRIPSCRGTGGAPKGRAKAWPHLALPGPVLFSTARCGPFSPPHRLPPHDHKAFPRSHQVLALRGGLRGTDTSSGHTARRR